MSKSAAVLAVFSFAAVFSTVSVTLAQYDQTSFSAILQYSPFYPPDVWVPLRFEFRNMTDSPIDGDAVLPISDESGGVEIHVPTTVAAKSKLALIGHGYFPFVDAKPTKINPAVPPIGIAEWKRNGGTIGRCEILAKPVSEAGGEKQLDEGLNANNSALLLGISGDQAPENNDAYDTFSFTKLLQPVLGVPMIPSGISANQAPRQRVGYTPCRIVVLDSLDPDELDPAQRQALMTYVITGGTVIVPAPLKGADPTHSWLAPHLPVITIGHRESKLIKGRLGGGDVSMKLTEPLEICEATPGDGQIVFADANYVHAAVKKLGLGRIIFTSFPINAPDLKTESVKRLWAELLSADEPLPTWEGTQLGDRTQRTKLIESMIGRPTVAWKHAAILAVGYVLAVLLIQVLVGGPRRPTAFSLAVTLAVAASIVLIAITVFKRRDEQLVGARIATLDLSPIGGGIQQQIATYLGKDEPNLGLVAANSDTTLRPCSANKNDPPKLYMPPFSVPQAGGFAAKIERVWRSESALPKERRIEASAVFGPDGLTLSVDNQIGHTLLAPLLVWGGEAFSLDDLSAGRSTARATPDNRNLRGPELLANVKMITSEADKLRGQILEASIARPAPTSPLDQAPTRTLLAAWLDEASTPPLVNISASTPPQMRCQALVRVPVRVDPSPIGSTVRIDGAFNQLIPGATGLPYDFGQRAWIPNPQEGAWLIGFDTPRAIGKIRPKHATISVDVQAPVQTMTLRRGQCRSWRPVENTSGPVVAEWKSTIGRQTASFDAAPEDIDADGHVWLYLQVQNPKVAPGDLVPAWQFRQFEMSCEAEVIGPPSTQPTTRPRMGG